jgi:hypothetical protein
MIPHYDRYVESTGENGSPSVAPAGGVDEEAMEVTAEALREVEVAATNPEPKALAGEAGDGPRLDYMNIDELRALAKELEVPERATITEKDELIAAIRQRL